MTKQEKQERLNQIRGTMKGLAREYGTLFEEIKNSEEKEYIPASGKSLGADEFENMTDSMLDGVLTAGRYNDMFEEAFAKRLGVKYAMTCNSGSSANLLALSALTSYTLGKDALKKGDEVISVASGFPTTIAPIVQNGLVPVFVDCEAETYNIKIEDIESAISDKTRAIFLAHTLGNMYDIDAIMDIAKRHNLWVIEDSCDALCAKWNDKYAGTVGHIGTFSFYPAHHITMGEGGAVITNDPRLRKNILSFRDWGRACWCKPGTDDTCHKRFNMKLGKLPDHHDHKYAYDEFGYNLKVTDMQAACGVAQLGKLDKFLDIRYKNAMTLNAELADLQEFLILPQIAEQSTPSWFGYLISVKPDAPFKRHELTMYLEKRGLRRGGLIRKPAVNIKKPGVGTRLLFAGNVLRQPMMVNYDTPMRIGNGELQSSRYLTEADYRKLPGSEFIMNNTFWVGVAQCNNTRDVKKISSVIHDFVEEKIRQ